MYLCLDYIQNQIDEIMILIPFYTNSQILFIILI